MNNFLIAGLVILVCILAFYSYKQIKSKKEVKEVVKTVKELKEVKIEKYEEPSVNSVSVLLCYANWCGHCPEVKEWYIDLVNKTPLPNVIFTMCEEQDLPAEILNSIPGFPSILIFSNGKMKKYPGNRTKEDLLRYLKNI